MLFNAEAYYHALNYRKPEGYDDTFASLEQLRNISRNHAAASVLLRLRPTGVEGNEIEAIRIEEAAARHDMRVQEAQTEIDRRFCIVPAAFDVNTYNNAGDPVVHVGKFDSLEDARLGIANHAGITLNGRDYSPGTNPTIAESWMVRSVEYVIHQAA